MGGGVPGNRDVDLNLTTKEVTGQNAPVGAVLVAQAMSGDDASMRYKGMQAVKDWDRTRLGYRAVKRVFDIVFSGCVLAVIAIPSLVLAAAIRLESEGNPFYSQIRVGQTRRDGSLSTFRMWKFRSMYRDADERLAELKERNEIAGAMFKMKEDPRVTKIGKFIRKHSIDEFPQFVNVFLARCPSWARARRCPTRWPSIQNSTCSVWRLSPGSPAGGRSRTATIPTSTAWFDVISSTSPNAVPSRT